MQAFDFNLNALLSAFVVADSRDNVRLLALPTPCNSLPRAYFRYPFRCEEVSSRARQCVLSTARGGALPQPFPDR